MNKNKKKKVVFIGPIADSSCPKCNVGTAIEDHTCPCAEDMNDDHESLCDCCEDCIGDCANDI